MGITIDGTEYNVRIVFPSLTRSFNIPQGANAGKSLAYSDIDDIFGTEYGYSFDVQPVPGAETEYDAFYYAISAPVGHHTVEMPFGQTTLSFSAKITTGRDKFYGTMKGMNQWRDLTVNFTPIQPQRT